MTRKEAIDKVYGMTGTAEQHEALDFLVPEIRELRESYDKQQEDEKTRRWLVDYFKGVGESWIHRDITCEQILSWLEKQKNTDFEIKALKDALAKQPVFTPSAEEDKKTLPPGFYFVDLDGNRYYSKEFRYKDMKIKVADCDQEEECGSEKIDNVFGFKIGDKVRLMDGDGRTHVIKAFEKVEGIHGPDFYHVVFEDDSASDHIIPDDMYPDGYFTCMEKVTEWSAEDEQMKANILNALTPNLVYTVGKGTTTGTSTYRYDKEIAWFKALCLKQGRKDKD
jgi:hypothetical protein